MPLTFYTFRCIVRGLDIAITGHILQTSVLTFLHEGDDFMPTITFVANPDKDKRGNLLSTGKTQAEEFAKCAKARGDLYTVILTGSNPYAREARAIMVQALGLQFIGGRTPGQKVQPVDNELFSDPPQYGPVAIRTAIRMALKRLGLTPLEKHLEYCPQALKYDGIEGSKSIRRFTGAGNFVKHMLVIGRPIFINQLILSFFGEGLSANMRRSILKDDALDPMTGYRFVVEDERWFKPQSMERVGWQTS